MPVYLFHSTETGLAGIQGSGLGTMITALDAMLVNGVNSSATGWSASWAGGTITYSKTGHGMPVGAPGVVLTITGFSPAGYNINNQTVVVVDANTITLAASNPGSTPATGTGTVLRSPCSVSGTAWTKAFSGTNLANYRQPNVAGSNKFYLGYDDSVAQNSRWRGFETGSAAGAADGSGTAPFPSAAQQTGGSYHYRSSTNDATARPWTMVSNGASFYFFNQYSGLTTIGTGLFFGDFTSYKTSDAYNTIAIGDIVASAITAANIRILAVATTLAVTTGHYVPRSYTQTGTSVNVGKHINAVFSNATTEIGAAGLTYPIGVEGGIMLSPIWLSETTNGIRGHLPGLWAPCHNRPLTHGDTFSGATGTPLEGKTFEVITTSATGQVVIETSNTWDA